MNILDEFSKWTDNLVNGKIKLFTFPKRIPPKDWNENSVLLKPTNVDNANRMNRIFLYICFIIVGIIGYFHGAF